jgi:CheY-specific phosphatase CheX
MLENSKDVLYIVISFCIIWLTAFLCYTFYYAARILKNVNSIVEEFRLRLQRITDTINSIQDKVEGIMNIVGMVKETTGGLVKNFITKNAKGMMNDKMDDFGDIAKDAVDRAVNAAGQKMKKVAKKMKK